MDNKLKKVALLIWDGFGYGENNPKKNAISAASTPFFDYSLKNYPNATLKTSGLDVGLPDGQMGNSEVGHLNIGAGRVVYQMFTKINKAFEEGTAQQNQSLQDIINYCKSNNKPLHLMGLVSNGGVHSSIEHLKHLISFFDSNGIEEIYIHAFTDGRDTDPYSGKKFLKDLEDYVQGTNAKIASIIGRYFAMDRDKRWERVKKAYDLLIKGEGNNVDNVSEVFENSYDKDITDEFIEPHIITPAYKSIKENDAVLFFNFRTDRGRQLTTVLTQSAIQEYHLNPLDLHFTTLTQYDATFKNINIVFEEDNLNMTLGEVLAKEGKTQLRIAETEKYPHVTFFFSGGRETIFKGERRIMLNSPKVATYDLAPEMSAFQIKEAVIKDMIDNTPDIVILNFANPDMVGHTGVLSAAVKAVETVDVCSKEIYEVCKKEGYTMMVIADHGNCDVMVNPDGTPNTAHTTNPVPVIFYDKDYKINQGRLADIAPTILKVLGLEQPKEMTGESLIY